MYVEIETIDTHMLVRVELMAATNENAVINPTHMVEAPLRATYMPTRVTTVSPIVLSLDANTINLRAGNIQFLPNFHGLENENSYEHIKTFEEACSINLDGKMNADTLYLKLFPFSLKDRARNWLKCFASSIYSFMD